MTDYMKEAERLADEYAKAVHDGRDSDCVSLRAALVAHIQRGVPEGWRIRRDRGAIVVEHPKIGGYAATADSESIAATILYEFANAMLAPAPDQFRDATKMMAEPAEVPMPEPIGFIDSNDEETWATLTQNAHELATLKLRSTVFHVSQMHTYGAACRAAGEAAGYARGLAEAGRDGECDLPPRGWRCTRVKGHSGPCAAVECPWEIEIVERAMARLRGEVKP